MGIESICKKDPLRVKWVAMERGLRLKIGFDLLEYLAFFYLTEFDEHNYLVFLLANIFTGLINFLINTRAQPPLIGQLIMMVYLGIMCSVGYGIANNETVSLHLVVS